MTVLLERGADIDARGYDGRTPLHLAAVAEGASVPFVSMLLERGAAVDARDDDGNTPLHLAAANPAPAMVAVAAGVWRRRRRPEPRGPDAFGTEPGPGRGHACAVAPLAGPR